MAATALEPIERVKVFNGTLTRYRHPSAVLNCSMTLAVYLPPQAEQHAVPVLYWLSGLTCTEQNFCQKAGAFGHAADLGLAIVCPDTSPRDGAIAGAEDDWDLGSGAGFYLNATQAPWAAHYRMFDYLVEELPALLESRLPLNGRRAISGHSMGGHGALLCALKRPDRYRSVSAFAPISNPSHCPWGRKAFSAYLGPDPQRWRAWDSCELIGRATRQLPLLVDQGEADPFLAEQLHPEALRQACAAAHYPLALRLQPGYDHSYYFIASFIADHLHFHARHLSA